MEQEKKENYRMKKNSNNIRNKLVFKIPLRITAVTLVIGILIVATISAYISSDKKRR